MHLMHLMHLVHLVVMLLHPSGAPAQDDVPLPRPQVVVPTDPPTFKTTRSLVTVDCVVREGNQIYDGLNGGTPLTVSTALLRDTRVL